MHPHQPISKLSQSSPQVREFNLNVKDPFEDNFDSSSVKNICTAEDEDYMR